MGHGLKFEDACCKTLNGRALIKKCIVLWKRFGESIHSKRMPPNKNPTSTDSIIRNKMSVNYGLEEILSDDEKHTAKIR